MADPVVHFEIVGSNPAKLREYYGGLFGWNFDIGDASAKAVSAPGQYGFVDGSTTGNEEVSGINGGVAGGEGFEHKVLFYVGVDDVEAALQKAESLGGKRVMGPQPEGASSGEFVVGHFTDPEGNLLGVAGLVP